MFASENLLLHDQISTLELKSNTVRWYAKEAILTDRALYLYKQRSNYVHDAHQRLTLAKYRAQRPKAGASMAYQADLPPMEPPYEVLVEILNKETSKKKIITCQSEEKAQSFVKLFNLVSAFSSFDDLVTAQRELQENSGAPTHGEFGLPSKADQKRIEQWVQNFVLEHEEKKGETMAFANEGAGQCSHLLRILSQYFKDTVTSLAFSNNSLSDSALQANLYPMLQSFQHLQKLEITNNHLTAASLETVGDLFQTCQQITDVNLSSNYIGGSQHSGSGERDCVDFFLSKLFTELQRPRSLDLSYNSLTDECLYPVVKYVFANHECKLESFNLENNRLSPFASRTLLKAHSISPNRDSIGFRYGPLPLGLENLRAGFVTPQDQECIAAVAAGAAGQADMSALQDSPDDQAHSGDAARESRAVELVIQRKSNNFSESGNVLKRAPVARADSGKMDHYLARIESTVQKREEIEIEELRAFVQEVTSGEVEFEIPRYRLEPIFNVVNEKLEAAIEHENIYMLEVLLDCLKFMNARNIPAEKKYYELASEAQVIAHQLLKVLNLEIKDETEMQRLLVLNLKRGKQIGLRGELIDTARHLYLLTDKVLGEMRGQAAAVSDDEDEAIYEVNEDDRPANVYDARLDKFIDLKPEDLGLTSDVEAHLAAHPYATDYIKLANLNLNYVKKNLTEAKRFLKDEESYAYRNIFERCSVLLSDAGEQSAASITYNLARNDANLKLVRLVFRYKNNLDKLFPLKAERLQRDEAYLEKMRNQDFKEPSPRLIENIRRYADLRSADLLASPEPALECSLSKLDTSASLEAVKFNRKLVEVLKGDAQASQEAKMRFYTGIQELFEEFIIQGVRPPGTKQLGLLNRDMSDEFYLQLFRQADLHMTNLAQKQGMKEFFNTMLLFALLSNYCVPCNRCLHEGLLHWLLQMRAKMHSQDTFRKIIARALNNFQAVDFEENAEISQSDQDQEQEEGLEDIEDQAPTKKKEISPDSKFENNQTGIVTWPPSMLEIESLATGQPISVRIHLTNGEPISQFVDEATTVETLLDHIRESHPYFKNEHETETFWLFRLHDSSSAEQGSEDGGISSQTLDFPLPKDKKILKLMYQAERQLYLKKQQEGPISRLSNQVRLSQSQRYDPTSRQHQGRVQAKQLTASDLQKCHFVVKRRIFPSLFVLKNFKKLHERGLDQVFSQLRSDHVDKNMLKDVCAPDDVVYFGALILKVKLQGRILRSKQNKISSDLILKNIDYAIPSCFIELDENTTGQGRIPEHWAQKIEDGYFKKKEFLDYSLEDAQEKFLSGIGLYNLMFSSYYVIQKGASARREADKQNLMSRIAAQKYVKMGTMMSASDDASLQGNSEDDSLDSEDMAESEGSEKNKNQFTIEEASSSDEKSSDSEDSEEKMREKKARLKKLREQSFGGLSSKPNSSAPRRVSKAPSGFGKSNSIWSQIQDDEILLVINLQGIQILENSKREKIVLHIDFEDILYVMGKGNRLKIGFVIQQQLVGGRSSSDCRTEFNTSSIAGHKARSIAEDIIAYAQLRLVEMTKNGHVEFLSRNHATTLFDKLEQNNQNQTTLLTNSALDGTEDEAEVNKQDEQNNFGNKLRSNSFKGLQDMQINQADLLDSFDLEEETEIMNGIGQTRIAEKLKDLTSAERYSKTISAQLGNCLKFKTERFFAYSKRYPLLTQPGHDFEKSMTRLGDSLVSAIRQPLNSSDDKQLESTESQKQGEFNPQQPRPRVGGSFSAKTKFNLNLNEHSRIEEQQDENEEDSSQRQAEVPQSQASQSPEASAEKKPEEEHKAPVWANFLQEFQQMNKQAQSSTESLSTDRGAGQPADAGRAAQQAHSPEKSGNLSPQHRQSEEPRGSAASQGKVVFKEIENKEARESAAADLFGQALMMAPTFD